MPDKLKTCKVCGNPIAKKAKRCPHCGAKNKKPIFARFWFWVLAVIVLLAAISSFSSSGSKRMEQNRVADRPTGYTTEQPTKENEVEDKTLPENTLEDTNETVSGTTSTPEAEKPQENVGLGSDFKQMMDSYEAFVDEYVVFCKKYADSDDTLSMLGDYTEMMSKYAEWADKIGALDESALSDSDALYYSEVTLRCAQKMTEAAAYLA